jgi:hypothetical protein
VVSEPLTLVRALAGEDRSPRSGGNSDWHRTPTLTRGALPLKLRGDHLFGTLRALAALRPNAQMLTHLAQTDHAMLLHGMPNLTIGDIVAKANEHGGRCALRMVRIILLLRIIVNR